MIKKSYWQEVDDSDHTDSRSVYDKLGDEYHNLKRENLELKAEVEHYKNQLDLTCEEGLTPADAKKAHEANAGLAKENTRLKAKVAELELQKSEINKGIDEFKRMHSRSESQIKADAIREAIDNCAFYHNREYIKTDELVEYANKLERGES